MWSYLFNYPIDKMISNLEVEGAELYNFIHVFDQVVDNGVI